MTHLELVLIVTLIGLGLLARLLRRPQHVLAGFACALRDLITLRMVLRDTDPEQRAGLLDAHCAWRAEPAGQPRRIPPQRTPGTHV